MNVTSLELCKELYEVSGWKDTTYSYVDNEEGIFYSSPTPREYLSGPLPAYDMGFLFRKLPFTSSIDIRADGKYLSSAVGTHVFVADTPEDATAKLAIELLRQGILAPHNNVTRKD